MSVDSPLRVLIIEHEIDGGPALFGERLARARANVTIAGPHLDTDIPVNLDGYDALAVLGGSPGPTDDEDAPWLPQVRNLLAEALEQQLPTLGICLGSQMLATVAGGRVDRIEAGPEIGLCEVEFTEAGLSDPLLSVVARRNQSSLPIKTVQWHYLEAKELPAGSVPLMSSGACQNQAFRVGERAWGVQFHPEALGQTSIDWSELDAKALARMGVNAETELIAPITNAEPTLRETWSLLFDRWIEIANEHLKAVNRVTS